MSGLRPHRLPGDRPPAEEIARLLRVDHAGEYGATRIYAGQLAIRGRGRAAALIREMGERERQHLALFEELLRARRVRPTALHPLWSMAGFALGAATALLGRRAAMACTVAVEEVIDEHYRDQAERLAALEPALVATILSCRDDELKHRETALAEGATEAPFYGPLTAAIKTASRLAIWLSTRF
jgi:ubiquinone biosynthesis monooxygenase Coq7